MDKDTVEQSLAGLSTEGVDAAYAGIDTMSTDELLTTMNQADRQVPLAVAAAQDAIAAAVDAVSGRLAAGGRLRYVGAGTAGRMAVLDASECPPTFSTPDDLVVAILAGGEAAVTGAVEGAEDDEQAAVEAMAAEDIGPDDAVVGVAASGRTPFVVAALREAKRRGAATVGLSCNRDAVLSGHVDHPIEVVVGPEVVAGSTRLKAGTAQKLVLNMISTASMVKLGKVYRNYMVDMSVRNEKLAVRAERMVAEITGAAPEVARDALRRADQRIKTAVVIIERDTDAQTARELLDAAGGRLGVVLSATEK